MSAEATTGAVTSHSAAGTLPRRSLGGLISISIFWFAINFHWAAILTIIVPSQVTGLLLHSAPAGTLASRSTWATDHSPLALALVVAPGLVVALIANPLFGLFSDRTRSRLGKRRPYILGGTLLNVVGLLAMAFLPPALVHEGDGNPLGASIIVLTVTYMLTQLGNNAAAAPFHALLPDLVPEEQRGTASGIMGLALFLGQICGAVAPALFGFNSSALTKGTQSYDVFEHGIGMAYVLVCLVIVVMAVLTAFTVHERPGRAVAPSPEAHLVQDHTARDLVVTVLVVVVVVGAVLALTRAPIGFTINTDSLSVLEVVAVCIAAVGAAKAFGFRPRRNPDFSWVVLTRMLVMMGVYTVQNFIQYYMRDVAHSSTPESSTAIFLVIVTVAALASTLLAGWGSDHFGRKRMVYISGTFMAIVGTAFVLAPYLLPGGVLTLLFAAGAIFGLGYGAYVSVDWALVADVLPSTATFARDMGVWNIALTLPQVIAAVLGGWLIALGVFLGSLTLGYSFLFVCFVVFCVLGTVTVRFIKGVR